MLEAYVCVDAGRLSRARYSAVASHPGKLTRVGTEASDPSWHVWSCTRPLRIIPLPLKPATMPHLTIPERGQGHGFLPFLLPTRSVGSRVALRHVACCRVSPRGSDTTDSDAHQV